MLYPQNDDRIVAVDFVTCSSMQWSHERMSAIVIFTICHQLLGDSPQDPQRGSTPGPYWGTQVPHRPPGSAVNLQVVGAQGPIYKISYDLS